MTRWTLFCLLRRLKIRLIYRSYFESNKTSLLLSKLNKNKIEIKIVQGMMPLVLQLSSDLFHQKVLI